MDSQQNSLKRKKTVAAQVRKSLHLDDCAVLVRCVLKEIFFYCGSWVPFMILFQFRDSLKDLMESLYATRPHYVRCIKPNDTKSRYILNFINMTWSRYFTHT